MVSTCFQYFIRHGTRRASQARIVASRKRDNRDSAPVGAPPTPLLGDSLADGRDQGPTRAQPRAAGTKKTTLFDIVNRDAGQRFALRAATSHAPCECPTL